MQCMTLLPSLCPNILDQKITRICLHYEVYLYNKLFLFLEGRLQGVICFSVF